MDMRYNATDGIHFAQEWFGVVFLNSGGSGPHSKERRAYENLLYESGSSRSAIYLKSTWRTEILESYLKLLCSGYLE